jgi:hypothetical protein
VLLEAQPKQYGMLQLQQVQAKQAALCKKSHGKL